MQIIDKLEEIKGRAYGSDANWLIRQVEELRSDLSTARTGLLLCFISGLFLGFVVGMLCR